MATRSLRSRSGCLTTCRKLARASTASTAIAEVLPGDTDCLRPADDARAGRLGRLSSRQAPDLSRPCSRLMVVRDGQGRERPIENAG